MKSGEIGTTVTATPKLPNSTGPYWEVLEIYKGLYLKQGGRSCAKARRAFTEKFGSKILIPNTRYFVAILRFVVNFALFGKLWIKKVLIGGQKQCF